MELTDRIVVVTGAANGTGRAMAVCFAAEGAKQVICVDPDLKRSRKYIKYQCFMAGD